VVRFLVARIDRRELSCISVVSILVVTEYIR